LRCTAFQNGFHANSQLCAPQITPGCEWLPNSNWFEEEGKGRGGKLQNPTDQKKLEQLLEQSLAESDPEVATIMVTAFRSADHRSTVSNLMTIC
jgi:hypothetical protein